ncbi:Mitochondrial import receptor subunit TOM20-2 [Linum perenne]
MEFTQEDFDRLLFMEQARQTAEASYAKDPKNADNLTKWGGALLQLSQLERGPAAITQMLDEAVSKFEEALVINPHKHEALWGMGNAETNYAFLSSDRAEAEERFHTAAEFYQRALDEVPDSQIYRQSLMEVAKAPELHRQAFEQTLGGAAASTSKRSKKGNKTEDLMYDVCGWVLLAVGVVALVVMSKSNPPPPPPPHF